MLKEAKQMKVQFPNPPAQSWYNNISLPTSWELVRGRLNGERVLDIGCASGWVAYYARKGGADVIATDIFDTMVHPSLPFVKCDKENLPFNGGEFDFVLTANVLHHGDLRETVKEAYRVLNEHGTLISFQEPCIPNDVDEQEFLHKHCQKELDMGYDERRPSLKQYLEALGQFNEVYFYQMDERMFGTKKEPGLVPILKDSHSGGVAIEAVK